MIHDVIVTSYCFQRYAECLVTTLCSSRTVHQHTAPRTCNSWNSQETPNFLASHQWAPNSPDLTHVDYEIWAVMQHRVYHRQIHSVYELKRRLINVWCGLEQSIFDEAMTSGEEDIERVSMLKEDISNTACELTTLILSISVTFNVTCLTVKELYKSDRICQNYDQKKV